VDKSLAEGIQYEIPIPYSACRFNLNPRFRSVDHFSWVIG